MWRELGEKLERECMQFDDLPELSGPELAVLQAETRKAVNRAVKEFSNLDVWPPLSERERTALAQRIRFACDLLKLLHGPRPMEGSWPVPQPSQPMQTMMEWILVDAWEVYGLPKNTGGADHSRN